MSISSPPLSFLNFSSADIPDPQYPHLINLVNANSLLSVFGIKFSLRVNCTLSNNSLVMIGTCLPIYQLPLLLGYSNSP